MKVRIAGLPELKQGNQLVSAATANGLTSSAVVPLTRSTVAEFADLVISGDGFDHSKGDRMALEADILEQRLNAFRL